MEFQLYRPILMHEDAGLHSFWLQRFSIYYTLTEVRAPGRIWSASHGPWRPGAGMCNNDTKNLFWHWLGAGDD